MNDTKNKTVPFVPSDDYGEVTPLDLANHELATIYYDYNVHPEAQRRIDIIVERLANE